MAKPKIFTCCLCNCESPRYLERCPDCGRSFSFKSGRSTTAQIFSADGDLVTSFSIPQDEDDEDEEIIDDSTVSFDEVEEEVAEFIPCGVESIDAVIGGGLALATAYLFGAKRGLGKSTLCLQYASAFCAAKKKVLMALAEQSASKSKADAIRVGCKLPKRYFAWKESSSWEDLEASIRRIRPHLVVIDSLDRYTTSTVEGRAGCPAQKETVANLATNLAHEMGFALVMISHVGKDGEFRGTTPVEHIVDVLLLMAPVEGGLIMAHCAGKNRVAAADVVRMLKMTDSGLISIHPSPSSSGPSLQV